MRAAKEVTKRLFRLPNARGLSPYGSKPTNHGAMGTTQTLGLLRARETGPGNDSIFETFVTRRAHQSDSLKALYRQPALDHVEKLHFRFDRLVWLPQAENLHDFQVAHLSSPLSHVRQNIVPIGAWQKGAFESSPPITIRGFSKDSHRCLCRYQITMRASDPRR